MIRLDNMENGRGCYRSERDLREGRLRYFETHAFPLFSHIDLRVSDADAVRPFYAVFFEDPLGNRFEVCHHRMDK